MKPKKNYRPGPMDSCQTPTYALDPILPYLRVDWKWWEPCAGKGNIVHALEDNNFSVTWSDIIHGEKYDYFSYSPNEWTASITNPPYGLKFPWLARCYELGKPFALLVPVEILGAKKCQELIEANGFEMMLLNRRVNFEMPSGRTDGQAQFPVFWLTWKILPRQVMFGEINYPK